MTELEEEYRKLFNIEDEEDTPTESDAYEMLTFLLKNVLDSLSVYYDGKQQEYTALYEVTYVGNKLCNFSSTGSTLFELIMAICVKLKRRLDDKNI